MSNMKKRVLRYTSFWLAQFFYIGLPLILLNTKYPILRTATKEKPIWSFALIIAIFFVAVQVKNLVVRWVKDLPEGLIKAFFINLKPMMIWGLAFILASWCNATGENVVWILKWSMISSIIGSGLSVWHTSLVYSKHAEERLEGRRS